MNSIVVGITGGIGSGKTTIAKVFSSLGIPVYNTDERGKDMYFKPEVRKQVEEILGKEAYFPDSTLNKKFITGKIFSDSQLLEKINSVIHPAVKNDFLSWKEKNSDRDILLKESALLFETGIYKTCDKNILVTAPEEIRIARVMKRDKLSHEEVQKRIRHQWSDEKKKAMADFVIDNSGEELVLPRILEFVKQLREKM